MNKLIKKFEFEGNDVRTVKQGEDVWFVAKDVCDILEINNPSQALSRLEYYEKSSIILNDGTAGNPKRLAVSESGLYSLIFSSRKKEAKEFRLWVTRDVLPAIRREGIYVADEATDEQKLYNYNMLETSFNAIGAEFFLESFKKCMLFHEENKTRLSYERRSKNRRPDKLRGHAESRIMIMERILQVAQKRSEEYRLDYKWELKSLVDEAIKEILLNIKTVKHNQTRGSQAQLKWKLKQIEKVIS